MLLPRALAVSAWILHINRNTGIPEEPKMSSISPRIPQQPPPALEVSTVGGGSWSLADQDDENFNMVVFYRGLHCPICSMYLGGLNKLAGEFSDRGVNILVVSSDSEERATEAKEKWGLDNLTVGYGVDLDKAREWGLYISAGKDVSGARIEEPALFSEPGLFLTKPDGSVYFVTTQTMPFARPAFAELLKGLDFVIAKNYPGRGEVVDHNKAVAAE
jgi:peroxiredoxin